MSRQPQTSRRIVILRHERDPSDLPRSWIVVAMAEAWEAMGHEVQFLHGVDRRPDADLVVPHVDLTLLPPRYVEFLEGYRNVVNRRVTDVSKRAFSRLRVRPGDPWTGPVIVKTNRNYAGIPEQSRLRRRWWQRRWFRSLVEACVRPDPRTGFHPLLPLQPDRYPVYDSVRDLPRGTLRWPHLHVERFLPERDGDAYCLRCYAFAGTAEVNVRIRAEEPVIKSRAALSREEVAVPDEMRALRAELGFDYGKFDHVVVDGEVHLLDTNRTPTFAALPQYSERQVKLATGFAQGLLDQFGL